MLRSGEKKLLIDKNEIETVLMQPEIQKVPDADEAIQGISVYRDRLVIYYLFGEHREARCGIIMKSEKKFLIGFTSDSVEVEEREPEELRSVWRGIWEMRSD